jgi:hypothetical protein
MLKTAFLNDLSGLETSVPQLGHIAKTDLPSSRYGTLPSYLYEALLLQTDTTFVPQTFTPSELPLELAENSLSKKASDAIRNKEY